MFFKNNKRTKPKEINEINNSSLKESLADQALGLLRQGIDYNDLVHTKVKFGYLFNIENHGIEALFKVITDKTIVYFAVQGRQMTILDFSENLFQATVDGFMSLHDQH